MVNIYLFIELLGSADATRTVGALKTLQMENCTFGNVVMLSDEKLVAQLDCQDSSDGWRRSLTRSPRSMAWCRPISSPWCVPGRARTLVHWS